MSRTIDTLLLLALPASGKSEIRKFLATFDDQTRAAEFCLRPTVQLDDFPYVHLMRRTDETLQSHGHEPLFFFSPTRPFLDPREWITLIELLNEDYRNLRRRQVLPKPGDAFDWWWERLRTAERAAGMGDRLANLGKSTIGMLKESLSSDCMKLASELSSGRPVDLAQVTVVIEFARGGPDGARMPLQWPFGYASSLAALSDEILQSARILYVWVMPEDSRRKNLERADPNDPGSVLHHSVPIDVMLNDYGCDDIHYLLRTSHVPGTIAVRKQGRVFLVPAVRFDNRRDKTSFVRTPRNEWTDEQVSTLRAGLSACFKKLAEIETPNRSRQ